MKKIKNAIIKIRDNLEKRRLRKRLNLTDFTIISNNCWGSFTYQKYGIEYKSPTVGLFILGHDFVKLCADWENYNITVIATDGIAVVVNNANPLDELSADQVKDIYVGNVSTWDEITK